MTIKMNAVHILSDFSSRYGFDLAIDTKTGVIHIGRHNFFQVTDAIRFCVRQRRMLEL